MHAGFLFVKEYFNFVVSKLLFSEYLFHCLIKEFAKRSKALVGKLKSQHWQQRRKVSVSTQRGIKDPEVPPAVTLK